MAEGANVEVGREGLHSCFREVLKPACKLSSLVLLRVEVRAVDLLARARVFALFSLEEIWMVLQLLPTMRVAALVLQRAALGEGSNHPLSVPGLTHLRRVGVQSWPAAVVLPVVRIHTGFAVMIVLAVGAPNSLEVKEVEIHIDVVLLNQLDRDLLLIVREAAELLVLAADIVQVRLTELCLVFVWVIKGLHFVVRTITVVTVLAVDWPEGSVLLCLKDIVADL